MFEKTSRLAEQVATSVSRRGFLDSLGGWAATAALGVAGVLTGTGAAWAHPEKHSRMCCTYGPLFIVYLCVIGTSCPPTCCGSPLVSAEGPYESDSCYNTCGNGFSTAGCPC
jgi:hypothetical protein